MDKKIIIIGGPTASGKTALALDVARNIDSVIINADSQQVYREIPIITAQPTKEEQAVTPHKLYGVISVQDYFSVAMWLELVTNEINFALQNGKTPILVGGTGMYIKSLVEGIAEVPEISTEIRDNIRKQETSEIYKMLLEKDPEMASRLKPADRQRVLRAYEVFMETGKSLLYWHQQKPIPLFPTEMIRLFFLLPDREKVYEKCNIRFLEMFKCGLLEEVTALDKMNIPSSMPAMRAHGLREMVAYVRGGMPYTDAIAQAQQNTRKYVKRQFTWFRHQMDYAIGLEDNNTSIILDTVQ